MRGLLRPSSVHHGETCLRRQDKKAFGRPSSLDEVFVVEWRILLFHAYFCFSLATVFVSCSPCLFENRPIGIRWHGIAEQTMARHFQSG